jgi:di/tricarboxylate transporter
VAPAGPTGGSPGTADQGTRRSTPVVVLTLLAIAAVVVGAVLGLDVGLMAIAAAVLLALVSPSRDRAALAEVPWSLVFLVAGTVTYVGLMDSIGALDRFGSLVVGIGAAALAVLAMGYVSGITSAIASSTGVMTAMIALAVPLLQTGALPVTAVVGYIVVAATIVDVSPFSGQGASVIANATADERPTVYRAFLYYGGIVTAVAPLLVWLGVIVL